MGYCCSLEMKAALIVHNHKDNNNGLIYFILKQGTDNKKLIMGFAQSKLSLSV